MTGPAPLSRLLDVLPGGGGETRYVSLERAAAIGLCPPPARMPAVLKILVESALRHARDFAGLDLTGLDERPRRGTLDFRPSRLLLQDFTGVPLMTDLASLRDAVAHHGGDPASVNPKIPIDFVCDHALIAVHGGRADARALNERIEIERNRERFEFLKWCAGAFSNLNLIPPGSGIMHQLNLEYLSQVVRIEEVDGVRLARPDTLLGTDSHTPMVGGMGVLGWGVGGIEAQAAMLGHGTTITAPRIVGLRLSGELPRTATATDLVLHLTELLRGADMVNAFVELFGDALGALKTETRATLANMAPEYGATSVYVPVDDETLRYLRLTGRDEPQIALVESYAKAQGLWGGPPADEGAAVYDDVLDFDLASVEPSLAGPKRPEQRQSLSKVAASFRKAFVDTRDARAEKGIRAGDVVIAAITSCTNTAHPGTMLTAGLLARRAAARGLKPKPWVKTSFAPGSRVVGDYLDATGLQRDLDALGFQIVGFGCTTCNGNSGPLPEAIERRIVDDGIPAVAVLSGNRNFAGRVHPLLPAAYLASPALVIAYAIAGTVLIDLTREPLGAGSDGKPVMLSDLWPLADDVDRLLKSVTRESFREAYRSAPVGHESWSGIAGATGIRFPWSQESTFITPSPLDPPSREDADAITGMRPLVMLGDGVTTDTLSPNGEIIAGTPAARFLSERGVARNDWGTYAARRGSHEIAVRGMFANPHIENEMAPGTRGPQTLAFPGGASSTIFDAGAAYAAGGTPAIIIAGKNYGSGSSRDWAAKGVRHLGVRAVLAESFERIHRANLVGVGVVPLTFLPGATRHTLGLTGCETFHLRGLHTGLRPGGRLTLDIERDDGSHQSLIVEVRLEAGSEAAVLRAGGLLPVLLGEYAPSAISARTSPS